MNPSARVLTDDETAAARTLTYHLEGWPRPFTSGRGPAYMARGPWWPKRLRSLATAWERNAKAARTLAAAMERDD